MQSLSQSVSWRRLHNRGQRWERFGGVRGVALSQEIQKHKGAQGNWTSASTLGTSWPPLRKASFRLQSKDLSLRWGWSWGKLGEVTFFYKRIFRYFQWLWVPWPKHWELWQMRLLNCALHLCGAAWNTWKWAWRTLWKQNMWRQGGFTSVCDRQLDESWRTATDLAYLDSRKHLASGQESERAET